MPSVYTDLNTPAQTLGGIAIYPILDPARRPAAVPGVSSDTRHAVEMPVAWLYELQDGTLGPPSAATAANPIVGAHRVLDRRRNIARSTSTRRVRVAVEYAAHQFDRRHSLADDAARRGRIFGAIRAIRRRFARCRLRHNARHPLSPHQLLGLTPRYASGGSEFGTQHDDAGEQRAAEDRPALRIGRRALLRRRLIRRPARAESGDAGRRLNLTRFVLTAHSHAPETTMLGEPRIAIWPVSDALTDATRTTAADRAVAGDATLGRDDQRTYYFQRHNAANATDDLNPSIVPGNATLFTNLINAGSESLPGYGGPSCKNIRARSGRRSCSRSSMRSAASTRSIPRVAQRHVLRPFAAGDNTGVGRGLVVPLTSTYQSVSLRGLGRYPTLFGLTLVFTSPAMASPMDDDVDLLRTTPDDLAGTSWKANFRP